MAAPDTTTTALCDRIRFALQQLRAARRMDDPDHEIAWQTLLDRLLDELPRRSV